MISPLIDLETRRKILFTEGGITVRNLANDSVIITFNQMRASSSQIARVKEFLMSHFRARPMTVVKIDLSQARYLLIHDIAALTKLKVSEFKGLAFLIRNRMQNLLVTLMTLRKKRSCRVRIFRSFNLAVAWSRSLK